MQVADLYYAHTDYWKRSAITHRTGVGSCAPTLKPQKTERSPSQRSCKFSFGSHEVAGA